MPIVVPDLEVNVLHIVGGVSNEDVVAVIDDIELGVLRLVVVNVWPLDIAPIVHAGVDHMHRVGVVVVDLIAHVAIINGNLDSLNVTGVADAARQEQREREGEQGGDS